MKLEIYLNKRGLSGNFFAAEAGISQSYVSKILHGDVLPSPHVMVLINKATNGLVTPNDMLRRYLKKIRKKKRPRKQSSLMLAP